MDLTRALRPRSLAVVGASPRSFVGRVVQQNCRRQGFAGPVTPVNPKYDSVDDVACMPSLSALPEPPDAVVALVGTTRVLEVAEEAAAIGAGSLVVPGGGFTDSGEHATQLGAQLAELSDATGLRVVGPNCMGLVDLTTGAMPYIGTAPRELRRGNVAAIAQSGAVIEALVNCGGRIPFSTLISSGTESATTTADYLRFFATDPETQSALVFIEGFCDADDVLAAARTMAENGKRVAACFVGRSARARDGILAHSGKLAPSARVTAAALSQAGIALADDLDELLAMGELLGLNRDLSGRRVHVVTNSGGEGNLLSDLAQDAGLELPDMTEGGAARLGQLWPSFHVANPLDPWGVADYPAIYPEAVQAAADEPGDVLLVTQDQQSTAGAYERQLSIDLAGYLADGATSSGKLGIFLSPTSQDPDPEVAALCRERGIGHLRGARPALQALGKLAHATPSRAVVERPARQLPRLLSHQALTEDVALEILGELGVATPRQLRVATADEAVTASSSLQGPVVVKAVADGLLHKSDLGLVRCGLFHPDDVRHAGKEILERARAEGFDAELLVVEQVQGELDVLVGYTRDPQFGPTTLVGLGGVWTEFLDSSTIHVGPLDLDAARELVTASQVGRMLSGARGGALHAEGVAQALCAVTDIGLAHPDVVAIDINPLIVSRHTAVAVDAVIQRTSDTTTGDPQ